LPNTGSTIDFASVPVSDPCLGCGSDGSNAGNDFGSSDNDLGSGSHGSVSSSGSGYSGGGHPGARAFIPNTFGDVSLRQEVSGRGGIPNFSTAEAPQVPQSGILDASFVDQSLGLIEDPALETEFGTFKRYGPEDGPVEVVSNAPVDGKAIAVLFRKGVRQSGTSWKSSFAGQDEATLSYNLFIPEDLDQEQVLWLPGLCGGNCPGGHGVPEAGFGGIFRLMPDDRMTLSLNYLRQPGEYWQDFPLNYAPIRGKWVTLKQRVKMNTPGQRDGQVHVWINDQEVLGLRGLELRKDASIKIDTLNFIVRYGKWEQQNGLPGHREVFAPKNDGVLFFDEIKVFNGNAGATNAGR
jgi:hypothetical protein